MYQPNEAQIRKIKRKIGKRDFYTTADDYSYYFSTATQFFDSVKLSVVNTSSPFIQFVQVNGNATLIKTDTIQEIWSTYYFEPNQKPKRIDLVDARNEYKNYFGN